MTTAEQAQTAAHGDDHDEDSQDLLQDNDELPSPDGDGGHGADSKPSGPLQKRRRVTRACDTCRGKKIKCDGKQPCTHCTVYSYDCTYDQPSNRRRNPAPQYIEALENRLARAEALLKTVMPQADLNDPNLGNGTLPPLVQFPPQMPRRGGQNEEDKNSMMESMIEGTGSIDLDDSGRLDFYGSSSGRVFFERIRQQMGNIHTDWSNSTRTEALLRESRKSHDSPRSADSPGDPDSMPNWHDLPSKETGQALCELAIEDALCLLRFLHNPTFWTMFHRIYETHPTAWSTVEHKYLPIVYGCMALGTLFARTEDSKLHNEGYEHAIENGFKYWKIASSMMDMTDIRDLESLQAALLLTYFIQSSAKLSTCYSYVGACLYGSLRMGMHRNHPGKFDCLQDEMRKRTFWLIRKMDIYVGGILGMPILLSDDDIDQEMPAEVDDEFILPERILPQPEGRLAMTTAVNVHSKLLNILAKILKYVYPLKQTSSGDASAVAVSYSKIREVEKDLQDWMEGLPMALRPGSGGDIRLVRIQHMLRMSFAHVQMTLYRPFLHYIVSPGDKGGVDKRFYACAAACVSVARNVIHIMSEMNRRHLLIGAYWFQMYTTFWAIVTLVYYSIENQNIPTAMAGEYFNDALDGKDMLSMMAKHSNAADRCNSILVQLFAGLPARFQRGRDQTSTLTNGIKHGNKRTAHSQPRAEPDTAAHSSPRSTPTSNPFGNPSRAATMPHSHQHHPSTSLHAVQKPPSLSPAFTPKAGSVMGDQYVRPPHGIYTPPKSTDALTHPGTSPENASSPASAITFSGGIDPTSTANFEGAQHAVQDLTSMMFPTGDPFAYPNQPMTTFENHFGPIDTLNGGFDLNGTDASAMPQTSEPQTIGEWMAPSTSGATSAGNQPIGPTAPADFGLGDWIRTTQLPPSAQQQQQQQQQSQMRQAHQQQHGQQVRSNDNPDPIGYDAFFGGGNETALGNMGMSGWFNNGLV